ncbi:MAG: DNA methyltransferase [Solirubrobacterales bacterium]
MAASSEEIRPRLTEFAAKWGGYSGSERAEAQTFLNELLRCYGTDRQDAGAEFERPSPGTFVDMVWPGICIVEMKRPPENLDALLFLAGREPGFFARDALTRDAVALVTDLYASLDERDAADDKVLHDFVLQGVWSMFAEDLGMLPDHLFTRLLDGLLKDPSRSSVDDVGRLFRYLAEPGERPDHGVYAGTPYADGGLFDAPTEVHLEKEEVETLRQACDFDWTQVEPAIFGALLQGALGKEKQWALGAHYRAEADILKVVLPTVVEPWRDRLAALDNVTDAQAAQRDLMSYVVLDPACGSGNFLYVAYRELRRVEAGLRRRAAELRREAGLGGQEELALYPITNMKGIEIEPFAVKLARVTMWIGHKLAVEELGVDEPVLPLVDLSGIQQGDALRLDWPRADAIVSNPPYHGSQLIREELGDEYAEWLKREFEVGLKDYAVYWFRKAHERLEPGDRAGLVATNSVSQGRARGASLEWIIDNGGVITSAVSKQPWSGEAVVNVSIVNWIKQPPVPPAELILDGVEAEGITAALRPVGADVSQATVLAENRGRAFQGPIPVGEGFVIPAEEAERLRGQPDADYAQVVRRYLIGKDIANDPTQGQADGSSTLGS